MTPFQHETAILGTLFHYTCALRTTISWTVRLRTRSTKVSCMHLKKDMRESNLLHVDVRLPKSRFWFGGQESFSRERATHQLLTTRHRRSLCLRTRLKGQAKG